MGKAATTPEDWRRRAAGGLAALRQFSAAAHAPEDEGWVEAAGRAALALVEGGEMGDAVPLASSIATVDAGALPTSAAAWAAIGLSAAGDADAAQRALTTLPSRVGADGDAGSAELSDAAAVALGALHVGDVGLGQTIAGFLRPFAWDQPEDLAGLALARAADGSLVEGRQRARAHAGPQDFWVPGLAAGVLALIFEESGDDDDLAAAVELHDLTAALGDDVWTNHRSAPLAWAAAGLFAITGEEPFVATIERICDVLCETQQPDGSWGDPGDDAWSVLALLEAADAIEERRAVEASLAEQAAAAAEAAEADSQP